MFTHCDEYRWQFGEMTRLMEEGTRYYKVDSAVAYPSVTSVISFIKAEKFVEWRKKVGEEEANKITKRATNRGTRLHKLFEDYLQNKDVKELDEWDNLLVRSMFKGAQPHIDKRINNIYQQETNMYSSRLCLAGTVDLICEFDGELAIVDFKTSKQEKPEEWLEDYFVQLSAYWAMFAERTGVSAKKLVVFLVTEDGQVQIVERRNIIDYLKTLKSYVTSFLQYRDGRS